MLDDIDNAMDKVKLHYNQVMPYMKIVPLYVEIHFKAIFLTLIVATQFFYRVCYN